MPRVLLSRVSPGARPGVRLRHVGPPVDRVRLNDLFALFPALPPFRHRPLAEQVRRVREQIERVQAHSMENVARQRAAAARVKQSWRAKRGG